MSGLVINSNIPSITAQRHLVNSRSEMEEAMEGENKELLDLVLDSNPERLEIKAANLLPIMVKALQEMSSKIKTLETELKKLKQ